MNCECCGKPLIEKTEAYLLAVLRKFVIEDVSEMAIKAYKAYKYVYDCQCPLDISKLEKYRNIQWYSKIKKKQE